MAMIINQLKKIKFLLNIPYFLDMLFFLLFIETYFLMTKRSLAYLFNYTPESIYEIFAILILMLPFRKYLIPVLIKLLQCLRLYCPKKRSKINYSSYISLHNLKAQAILNNNSVMYDIYKEHRDKIKYQNNIQESSFAIFILGILNSCYSIKTNNGFVVFLFHRIESLPPLITGLCILLVIALLFYIWHIIDIDELDNYMYVSSEVSQIFKNKEKRHPVDFISKKQPVKGRTKEEPTR